MQTIADIGARPGKPPLTDEEKQAIADERNANEARRPLRDWQREMAETDVGMPRVVEDVIDAFEAQQFARLSPETKAAHANKKAVRARMPT